MGAHEKQFQAFIGKLHRHGYLLTLLPEELNRWLAGQDNLLVTHKIDDRVTRSRQ